MRIKSISFLIFIIGVLYMVVDGWIISWFLVPEYRELGQSFISDRTFFTSNTFFIFWAVSVPLGSIITVIGLAVYVKLDKFRFLLFIGGSIIFLYWLAAWSQSMLYPTLYGIGGGIILTSFIVAIWSLSKLRLTAKGIERTVLDLKAIAYIFLLITAWGMCGLLGVPSFGLTPEKLLAQNNQIMMYTMGAKILVCFVLGWISLSLSQFLEMKNR